MSYHGTHVVVIEIPEGSWGAGAQTIDTEKISKLIGTPRRLDALPWTQYCLRCQQSFEEVEKADRRVSLKKAVNERTALTELRKGVWYDNHHSNNAFRHGPGTGHAIPGDTL
jgi:hypothetical protein